MWTAKNNAKLNIKSNARGYSTTMNQPKLVKHNRVIVVGAGIAGLTFGIAFKKTVKRMKELQLIKEEKEPELLIIERRSKEKLSEKTPGSGIGLWGPALLALQRMGLKEQVDSISKPLQYAGYRASNGDWLVRPDPLFDTEREMSIWERELKLYKGCRTLTREDFHHVLLEELSKLEEQSPSSLPTLLTETSLQEIKVNEDEVEVILNNGEIIKGDFCIGADGIHSIVRRKVITDKITPKYCGYAYYRANLSISDLPDTPETKELEELTFESWGSKGRYGVVPLPNRSLFWFAAIEEPPAVSNAPGYHPRDVQHGISNEMKEDLIRFFRKSDWMGGSSGAISMIESTPPQDILRTEIYDLSLPSDQWADDTGRVILIGDAAHAVSPNLAQGALLSIQDSLFLAPPLATLYREQYNNNNNNNNLNNIKNNNEDTLFMEAIDMLGEYTTSRYKYARRTRIWSRMVAFTGQLSSPLSTLRNICCKIAPSKFKNYFFDQLHRYLLAWSYAPPSMANLTSLWEELLPPSHISSLPNDLRYLFTHMGEIKANGIVNSLPPSSLFARVFAGLSRFPPAKSDVPYRLHLIRSQTLGGELWRTFFGDKSHYEFQTLRGNLQSMRKGPGIFSYYLPIYFDMKIDPWNGRFADLGTSDPNIDPDSDAVGARVDIARARLSLLLFSVPLPRFCLPKVHAILGAKADQQNGYYMNIKVDLPFHLGTIFQYRVKVDQLESSPLSHSVIFSDKVVHTI